VEFDGTRRQTERGLAGASGLQAPARVLHLIEDLGSGGAERLLFVNLSRLDRTRVTGRVCHLYDRALHWRTPIMEQGYPVTSLHLNSVRDLLRGVVRLRRLLQREPVDVIHTHLFGANVIGRLAARSLGLPVVSSLHNPDYEPTIYQDNPSMSRGKLWMLRQIDRWSCHLARPDFVAVSEYVKQSAVARLGVPAERTTVVYNPIDPDTFTRRPEITEEAGRRRAELGLRPDDPVLVCVARLDPQKGLKYLIDAMPALIRDFPRVTTLLVGGGAPAAQQALMQRAAALDVHTHVRCLGPQADVRPFLEMADVFVLPSLYEGMGISLVEAMAMERPCVATNTTAIPEVVDDGRSGLLVNPGDAPGLAAAIATLLRDPALRARMGAEGRRIALDRFDVRRNIGQLEMIYSQALRQRTVS
jgi:glycosyltransferase involved in cell wall biosynthesis